MINPNQSPSFPGIEKPSIDFQPVRDQRRSMLLYYDLDLTNARSYAAGTHELLPVAGNSFYVDQNLTISGEATAHFQDSVNAGSAPVFVNPGFIARVPFTQIIFENDAQPGKILRFFYGVDVDFIPGVNANIVLNSTVPPRFTAANTQKTVTNASAQLVAANTSRNYLLVQNKDLAGDVYVTFGSGAATTAAGVKIAAGGSFELNSNVITSEVRAIGSIASNANVVVVEG